MSTIAARAVKFSKNDGARTKVRAYYAPAAKWLSHCRRLFAELATTFVRMYSIRLNQPSTTGGPISSKKSAENTLENKRVFAIFGSLRKKIVGPMAGFFMRGRIGA